MVKKSSPESPEDLQKERGRSFMVKVATETSIDLPLLTLRLNPNTIKRNLPEI